ncbi:MAG: dTMP kinase [Patescibacteria group bacterium]|nr:dTMP kinase [Patescibacteria group bacterium]
MNSGKLVVIEGSDGSGKATQAQLLYDYCNQKGIPSELFDFPQYEDFFGAMCKEFLRGSYGDTQTLSPYLSSLPYALDRWKAKQRIQDALAQKKIVIANRYVPSNAVYQGVKLPYAQRQAFIDWIIQLEYQEFGLPREDIVFYLHVPTLISQSLMANKQKDEHEKNREFLEKTEEMYKMFCDEYPHWVFIECSVSHQMLSKQQVHEKILSVLRKRGVLS